MRRSSALRLLVVGAVAFLSHLSFLSHFASLISGCECSHSGSNTQLSNRATNGIDTAIIITSSWIPSHPSTLMVEKVVNSIDLITSLHPSTPIFITIDQLKFDRDVDVEQIQNRSQSLDQYMMNLFNLYLNNSHVHILPFMTHSHIAGSVSKAMEVIERHYPTTRYLYYLQHDFYFVKRVDHMALIRVMETHENVNYILFRKTDLHLRRLKPCGGNETENSIIDIDNDTSGYHNSTTERQLIHTSKYSDNNHLVRFQWYKNTIASLLYLTRAPEDPLQNRASKECRAGRSLGLYVYKEEGMIAHLDGRNTGKI